MSVVMSTRVEAIIGIEHGLLGFPIVVSIAEHGRSGGRRCCRLLVMMMPMMMMVVMMVVEWKPIGANRSYVVVQLGLQWGRGSSTIAVRTIRDDTGGPRWGWKVGLEARNGHCWVHIVRG